MIKYIKYIVWGLKRMLKLNMEEFIAQLNAKWKIGVCPMCGKKEWNVVPDIHTLLGVDEEGNMTYGGKFIPLVAVVCKNCGNTVFVNPIVTGVVIDDGSTKHAEEGKLR